MKSVNFFSKVFTVGIRKAAFFIQQSQNTRILGFDKI